MQIVHIHIADFFGNDRLNLDLISANNRQFENWSNWTILTSVILKRDLITFFDFRVEFDYFG
jgi:hypothetical protein